MVALQVKLAWSGDLAGFARDTHLKIARGARVAAEKQSATAKLRYRAAVRSVLGDRVANAVRVDIYPKSASVHTHTPAVQVWTKAPAMLYAFATGVTIKNQHGLWLAIPTPDTPRKGKRRATPEEVKDMFGKLIYIHGRGGQLLAFVDAIKAKSGKGFRKATKRRTKDGRQNELVLMFVFVRQVRLDKRLPWDRVTDDLSQNFHSVFAGELSVSLSN